MVDITQPLGERKQWWRFEKGFLDRIIAGQTLSQRDLSMLKFLLVPVPGRNTDYYGFAFLAQFFAGSAYEKQAIALLRPILQLPGLNPYFYCFAAHGLASLNDKDSVIPMQVLLCNVKGEYVSSIRRSICRLGGRLPPGEVEPPPQ